MIPALLAIGGAVDYQGPGAILREFYRRAGEAEARIVIIPTASGRADAGEEYVDAFARLGAANPAAILPLRNRETALDPAQSVALDAATGVFFTGGNQVRLSSLLGGTPAEAALRRAYERGAIIGGTSAGAAILSAVMFAFGESGSTPRQSIAQFCAGLGYTDRLIFDQHFSQRDRLGRLLYAVANHPGVLGVGIDENTAALVVGDTLTVIGEHAVTIIDGSRMQATNVAEVTGAAPIAMSGASIHILTDGCTFDLHRRCAQIPEILLQVS